jgi:hypothetical protein
MDLNYFKLRPLDAVCIASSGIPGKTIRLLTAKLKGFNGFKEMWRLKIANHVGLIVELENRYWIAEMLGKGLKINSLKEYLQSDRESIVAIRRNPVFLEQDARNDANKAIISWAHETVKYDYKGLLEFLGICPDNPRHMYCSELAEIVANKFCTTWDAGQLINKSGLKKRIAPVEIQFGRGSYAVTNFITN